MSLFRERSAWLALVVGLLAGAGFWSLVNPSSQREVQAVPPDTEELPAVPPVSENHLAKKDEPSTASDEPQKWGSPHPVSLASSSPVAQYDPQSRKIHKTWDPGDAYLQGYEDVIPMKTVAPARNRTPVIEHPREQEQARQKLEALRKKTGKKPNVLIFLMDDVGWHDVGFNGGGVAVGSPTPNMDRLAREGLNLTSFYSTPTCTPTRASIITGRLPIRTGLLRPPMYGEKGGLETEVTVARLMSDAGYVTQAIGKWHIGENKQSQPHNVGFDDFFGFLSVSDMYTEWRDYQHSPEIVSSPARLEMLNKMEFNRNVVHAKKGGELRNVQEISIPMLQELDRMWNEYGVDFVRQQGKSDKPWFLYYCTRACHFDNYPQDAFRGKTPAKHPFTDCLAEADHALGNLVKALEETGQLENTLIIVTSDNGPNMETWPDSGRSLYRNSKGSTWEGGMRVPCIAYWKGMIRPGRVSDGLFDCTDLFTTAASLGGAKLPEDRFIDGIDQTSFLLAEDGHSNRREIFYWLMNSFSGVRVGEIKTVVTATERDHQDTVNPGGLSGSTHEYTFNKMFNLYMDPKEEHNYAIRKIEYISALSDPVSEHLKTFLEHPPKVEVTVAHIRFEPWMVPLIRRLFEERKQQKIGPGGHP
jgi:arylsulfatase